MDIYDAGFGRFSNCVVKVQVCLNGIPVDTISCSNGLSYYTVAGVGNIYSFKIISAPLGYSASGPSGGIVYDTISAYPDNPVKYLGLKCAGTSGFDLGLYTSNDFTRGAHQVSRIYTFNNSCNTENPSVTVQFSPKYVYAGEANPAPSLSSGNSLTWNLTGTDILHLPVTIFYKVEASPSLPLGHLIMGDTVQTYYTISPTTGDDDLSNNSEMVIDTVTSSYDPNEMSVTPSGYISSGTQLKYTINFENTGNDTAFNIHVMDTLSDNVDVKSLDLIMASAVMNIATFNQSGHNIVKFDFPNINLLDSTHHGLCDGAVIFTINTKTGLPNGTLIDNRAGIYFDYNPVVMTNQVENIIGIPSGVSTINASSKVELYPNPVSNELTIKTDNTAYNSATISNIMGQVMMTEEISTALTKVNVQRLPAGMYYITLRGESGVKVMKFEKM